MLVKPPVPKALLEWFLTSRTANSARWGKGAPLSLSYWPPWCAKLVRVQLFWNNQGNGGFCCQFSGLEMSVYKLGCWGFLCVKIHIWRRMSLEMFLNEFMEKTQTCNSLFTLCPPELAGWGNWTLLPWAVVSLRILLLAFLTLWTSCALSLLACFLPVGWMLRFVLYIWHAVGVWVFIFTAFNTSAPFLLLLSLGKISSSSEHSVIWFLILREVFWSLGFGPIFQEFRTWVLVVGRLVWHRAVYLLSAHFVTCRMEKDLSCRSVALLSQLWSVLRSFWKGH